MIAISIAVANSSSDVTVATQAITFAMVGGFFTLITLFLTNRSKRHSEELAARQHEKDLASAEASIAAAEEREAAKQEAEEVRQVAKEERDYARLDEVADRAERNSLATLKKLQHVEETTTLTHAMVNSDKTAGLADRLDDKTAQLALMLEIVSLKKAAGKEPTPETNNAIDTLLQSIETLKAHIADRLVQQTAAEEQNRMESTIGVHHTFVDGIQLGVVEALEARVETLEAPAEPLPPPPPQ